MAAKQPSTWFGRRTARLRRSRGDIMLIGGGLALGVACAYFPWYVFNNQEQFGVRAMKFSGTASPGEAPQGMPPAGPIDEPTSTTIGAAPVLDTTPTGTVPRPEEPRTVPSAGEQPFPEPSLDYRIVHIANGRAMLEDDRGLFLIERGAVLPDSARVRSIELRDGRWVVVTDRGRVIDVAP